MREPWEYEDPSCASVGGDFWFAERDGINFAGTDEKQVQTQVAKKICGSCTHKIECQQWGLKHERFGIWGGLSESDRRPIRKRLNIIVEEINVVGFTACVGDSPYQSNSSS